MSWWSTISENWFYLFNIFPVHSSHFSATVYRYSFYGICNPHTSYWIPISRHNTWTLVCQSLGLISDICHNFVNVSWWQISESGIIYYPMTNAILHGESRVRNCVDLAWGVRQSSATFSHLWRAIASRDQLFRTIFRNLGQKEDTMHREHCWCDLVRYCSNLPG